MARYIITYDLKGPNPDFEALYECIRAYCTYAAFTESSWAIVTRRSALDVANHLYQVLKTGDKLVRPSTWVGCCLVGIAR